MSDSPDEPPLEGKPPKDAASMRTVLKHVHSANLGADAGDRASGLRRDDQLHLTSFHNERVAREFQRTLSAAAIPSQIRSDGAMFRIEVDMEDRDRAHALLPAFQKSHPDHPDARRNQRFDCAILGIVVGLTVGLVLSLATISTLMDFARVGLLMAIGALTGHLLDRLRLGKNRGILRFGVYEFLILAMIPALAIVLYRITPALVFK